MASQKLAYARAIDTILEDLRPSVSDGRVPLALAVKVAVKYRRVGYQLGWSAMWSRARRASAARLAS